tara:strand:+ start:236 stop:484 length:249 start_codon:yes stop_codon:yes gene_type:complete
MTNKESFALTGTKIVLSVLIPLVATVGFVFSMNSDVVNNKERIEQLESQVDDLKQLIIENNTNIKLMQKDISIIIEQMKEDK